MRKPSKASILRSSRPARHVTFGHGQKDHPGHVSSFSDDRRQQSTKSPRHQVTKSGLETKIVDRKLFACDPRRAARNLLGKVLIRHDGSHLLAGRIVEVEAYLGAGDLAAHAAAGLTDRNRVLFGPPGHAYIYFIYGNYYCLNVSCEREGKAGSLLVRALEPLAGIETMARNRKVPFAPCSVIETRPLVLRKLTSGPGRLCDAFSITRVHDNDKDLCSAASDLYLADDGFPPSKIATTPRIGITKSADAKLRYVLAGNPYVSGKRTN